MKKKLPFQIKSFLFALFLVSGNFKSDPRLAWLPIDLTLLTTVLIVIVIFYRFVMREITLKSNILWMILFSISLLFVLPWTDWTPYAIEKCTRFFIFTFFSMLVPFFLFDDIDDIYSFITALISLGLIISFDALLNLIGGLSQPQIIGRLTSFGSNTISLGRYSGTALIWIFFNYFRKAGYKYYFAIVTFGILFMVLLGSGSRGPLIFALLSIVLTYLIIIKNKLQDRNKIISFAIMCGFIFIVSYNYLPESSRQRIELLFNDTNQLNNPNNSSVITRTTALELSFTKLHESPFGIGWGGFEKLANSNTLNIYYPHNIIIEIALEYGIISCVFLLVLFLKTIFILISLNRRNDNVLFIILFSLFIFNLFNSFVSGDINDNRILFALISSSLFLDQNL